MNGPFNNQLTIEIANEQSLVFDETPLLEVARLIFVEHGIRQGELSIAVVDDPTIRSLNKRYLDHDFETDVLSFVLDRDQEIGCLNGQLIVSSETATRAAAEFGISMDDELLLYVVHGTLHLVGLRDHTDEEMGHMRAAEANYLARFGVEHRWMEEPTDLGGDSCKEL